MAASAGDCIGGGAGVSWGGGIFIFWISNRYAWAVGVALQQTSSVAVDARTSDTRDAAGGTSTSKYHKSLQQTYKVVEWPGQRKQFLSTFKPEFGFLKTMHQRCFAWASKSNICCNTYSHSHIIAFPAHRPQIQFRQKAIRTRQILCEQWQSAQINGWEDTN